MTLRNQAFAGLEPQQPDGLLALIAQCRADPRPDKVDVGVGVYRGEAGGTPVMRAVKAAEAALIAGQASKSYLGAEGDERFARLVWQLVSGEERSGERRFGLQTSDSRRDGCLACRGRTDGLRAPRRAHLARRANLAQP